MIFTATSLLTGDTNVRNRTKRRCTGGLVTRRTPKHTAWYREDSP